MFNFIDNDDSIDLQIKKAVVIGAVGSGKTSLCRYVSGLYDNNNESMMSGYSVTKGVKQYKAQYLPVRCSNDAGVSLPVSSCSNVKVQYVMTDSEGYGGDNFSSDTLRNQLVSALRFETELHCVILVASFERFRNGLREDLTHIISIINTLGLAHEHMIICFTHCEMYNQVTKDKYLSEFKDYYSLNINDSNVVFGCFSNIGEINEKYKSLLAEDVKESIYTIRQHLFEKKESINVAMMIDNIESK